MTTGQSIGGPILEFRDVSIAYGSEIAVRHVNLDIEAGHIYAIVGESGSGKTTLMRAAYGLLPDANITGTIRLNGQDVSELTSSDWRAMRGRHVSMIFQNPSAYLNPNRLIVDHVKDLFAAHGETFSLERIKRILDVVELVDTERILGSYPFQLSGGMQQRVAIALSLVLEPTIVFADEPTSALDVLVEQSILTLLKNVARTLGTTIVLVTHNIKAASAVADYACVMYRGDIVEQGPMEAIMEHPREEYTKLLLRSVAKVV